MRIFSFLIYSQSVKSTLILILRFLKWLSGSWAPHTPRWFTSTFFICILNLRGVGRNSLSPSVTFQPLVTTNLEWGFPPQMPQNRPLVISHPLREEKNCPSGWIWWFWGAASGHEVLEDPCLVSTGDLSLISQLPWNPGSLSHPGTAGVALQGSGEGDRDCRDRRWLLSPFCHLLQIVGLGKVRNITQNKWH